MTEKRVAIVTGGSRGIGEAIVRQLAMAEDIEQKVIEIVSEQMGVDKSEITRETHFINDLNADSLDTVELVMEFEDEFELSIPDEEAEKIQTVGQAIDYIKEHSASNGNRRPLYAGPLRSVGDCLSIAGNGTRTPSQCQRIHEQASSCHYRIGSRHVAWRNVDGMWEPLRRQERHQA
jgi:acyl carrier protein